MDEGDAKLRVQLERLKHYYGLEYEMIRAIAAFEHAAIRPLFVLNGGALVLYLGLVGALRRGEPSARFLDWTTGKYAMIAWAVGLICAYGATLLATRSQGRFRHQRGLEVEREEVRLGLAGKPENQLNDEITHANTTGNCDQSLAKWIGAGSLLAFLAGLWPALASILRWS